MKLVSDPNNSKANLVIVAPGVLLEDRSLKIEIRCPLKRQTTVTDVGVVFIGVELDMHKTNCSNSFAVRLSFLLLQ